MAGKKRHIGRDSTHTFCGNAMVQQTKHGPSPLWVGAPWWCTCNPCLTAYYNANPLQQKRTATRGVRLASLPGPARH